MSIDAVSGSGYESSSIADTDEELLKRLYARANHSGWRSNPLCPNQHTAKYAVIDRTKDSRDPSRIVYLLCEYHTCPYNALTYQATALLPNQFILALTYLKTNSHCTRRICSLFSSCQLMNK